METWKFRYEAVLHIYGFNTVVLGVSLRFHSWRGSKKMDDDRSNFGAKRIIIWTQEIKRVTLGTMDFLGMVFEVEITHTGSTSGYLFGIEEELRSPLVKLSRSSLD